MKTTLRALAALLLSAAAAAYEAKLAPASTLWIEGDSTLHAFASTASALSMTLKLEDEPAAALARKAPAALVLRVPVKELRSGKSALDENLRRAMKAQEHPEVVFALSAWEGAAPGPVKAKGVLTIAGVSKDVEVGGTLALSGAGLRLEGEKTLLMSDFGIKPPTMMMGAIKTADKVTVKFRLELERAAEDKAKDKES